jgi:hypothetical protein
MSFLMVVCFFPVLQRASLPVSLERGDEHLAVTDLAGARGAFDRFDDAIDDRVVDRGFDLHLRQKVDDVLRTAVQLGVALLAAETLDFGHRDALHADGAEGFADFVELERLDDGGHHFHGRFSRDLGIQNVYFTPRTAVALPRFLLSGLT